MKSGRGNKGEHHDHNTPSCFICRIVNFRPTGRFLAPEVADELDDLVHVVETLQLAVVVDDLHGVFDHLTRETLG